MNFDYQRTFNAIAAATRIEGGNIAISVYKFVEAFGSMPAPPAVEAMNTRGYVCEGCGRCARDAQEDMDKLRADGFLSCCPERNMKPVVFREDAERFAARPDIMPGLNGIGWEVGGGYLLKLSYETLDQFEAALQSVKAAAEAKP